MYSADFVSNALAGAGALKQFLPAVIFIIGAAIGFATGTSWGTIGIMAPIVVAVFNYDVEPELCVIGLAAACAGGVMGDHCSPISDTTIMASAGAHCYHLNHVFTQLPYALTVAAVAFVSFIIAGFIQNWIICLVIAIALMVATLLVIEKVTKSFESVPQGFIQMVSPILILTLAWTLCSFTRYAMFSADFVSNALAGTGSLKQFLPAVIFIIGAAIGFATGTSWGTIGIMAPIIVAVFDYDVEPTLCVIGLAAACAGGVMGDHCSPISDTTIMASAGAHCYHLNHVFTQLPYALTVAAVAFVSFIIAGLIQNWVICLAIAVVLMIATLLVIEKVTKSNNADKYAEIAKAAAK